MAGAVALCVLGAAFRFYHLDWKTFGIDESVTALRASGQEVAQFLRFVHDGKVHQLTELHSRFQVNDALASATDTVRSLRNEDPQHPPLYYLIERAIGAAGGTNVWWRRAASALFAVLAIPAMWWLGIELFGRRSVALIATALLAVSPFHVVYAQQAREYSLWTLWTLVASAFLLRALRTGKTRVWIAYAVTTAVSLWTFTFALFVVVAHALYVVLTPALRRSDGLGRFSLAAGGGLLAFVPWLWTIAVNSNRAFETTVWLGSRIPWKFWAGKWLFNLGAVFFDLDYLSLWYVPVTLIVAVLVVAAVVYLTRTADAGVRNFILSLGAVTALALAVPDVLRGESRSTVARYLVPLWIAVELAVAYALAEWGWGAKRGARALAGKVATVALLALGVLSCSVASEARAWWAASNERTIPLIAQVLDSDDRDGLIVLSGDDFYLLELSDAVNKPVRFQQHRRLGLREFTEAPVVYVVAKVPELVDHHIAPEQLTRRALPPAWPLQDTGVMGLRGQMLASRKNPRLTLDDVGLWVPAGTATARPRGGG